jgi:MoaA/NifB/PqqE/SkfB family radical SAM enzyme
MDKNAAACEQVYDFCRGHRLDFNPIMPVFGELYKNEDLAFSMSDKARARLTRLFEKMMRDSDGRQMSFAVVLDQILGRPREFRCWAGRIILLIEENGDVYPNGGCPRDWVLGNLRSFDYGLEKLFSSDQARAVLRRVRRCRRCRLPCETLTTLKYPEALHAYLKTRRTRAAQRKATKRGAR